MEWARGFANGSEALLIEMCSLHCYYVSSQTQVGLVREKSRYQHQQWEWDSTYCWRYYLCHTWGKFLFFFLKKNSLNNPLFGYFSPSGLENFWIIMLAIFGQSLVQIGLNWTDFKGFFRFNIPINFRIILKSFKNHIKIIQNYIKIIYKSYIIII